jgi:hypothetical protein
MRTADGVSSSRSFILKGKLQCQLANSWISSGTDYAKSASLRGIAVLLDVVWQSKVGMFQGVKELRPKSPS